VFWVCDQLPSSADWQLKLVLMNLLSLHQRRKQLAQSQQIVFKVLGCLIAWVCFINRHHFLDDELHGYLSFFTLRFTCGLYIVYSSN